MNGEQVAYTALIALAMAFVALAISNRVHIPLVDPGPA